MANRDTPDDAIQQIRNRASDLDSDGTGVKSTGPAPEPPAAEPDSTPPAAAHGPRFELKQLIGEGGMGQVYEAYDQVLNRRVALKLLRGDSASLARRFLGEARAQAKVDHQYICKIFDAGVWEGRPFIAMQYVNGTTLRRAAKEMTREQQVRIMKQVAEAIHEAHKQGLIHRDLKPANVMVERTDEGEWKPYVMDFGLAKDGTADLTTMAGYVVGTPSYMAPEQASGQTEMLDRRTDVYALGATMYDLLCGRPPYTGDTSLNILMQVVEKDATPLRKLSPGVPADLETIVMKCLEKQPGRRYPSARAVAEDLGRFLDGEPIQARRATIRYRAMKFAGKHRKASAAVTLAIAALIVVSGFYLHERSNAGKRARLAQAFGEEIRATEAWMRQEHLAPLHDTLPGRRIVRQKISQILSTMQQVGKEAYGPGHYAIGRAYMSLGETGEAEASLNQAWEAGYREPEVAYAIGLVSAQRYQEEMAGADRETNREVREARKRGAEKYRKLALDRIRQGKGAAETVEYGEALIAYLNGNYPEALDEAGRAAATVVWQYEADMLRAEVYASMFRQARDHGEERKALDLYRSAGTAYRQAIRKGESDERAFFGLCGLGESMMVLMVYQTGQEPDALYQEAIQACRNGLIANREAAAGYQQMAALHNRWAEYLRDRGEDPLPALHEAIRTIQTGVSFRPGDLLYQTMGHSFGLKAWYELLTGVDPRQNSVRPGVDSYAKALALNPNNSVAHNGTGAVYWIQACYELESGLDPRPTVQSAVRSYETAVRIDPLYAFPYSNMGNVIGVQARYEALRGIDPTASIQAAERNMHKAIAINSNYAYAFNNLGALYNTEVLYRLERGAEPGDAVEKSLRNLRKAVEINPRFAEAHVHMGHLFAMLADHELESRRDPSSSVASALDSLDRAAFVNANYAEACSLAGWAWLTKAEYEYRTGTDPADSIAKAAGNWKRAIAINPNRADAYVGIGRLEILKTSRRSPASGFQAAEAALRAAIERDPASTTAFAALAGLHRRRAAWLCSSQPGNRADITGELKAGLAAAHTALSINATHHAARQEQAELTRMQNMECGN